MVLHKKEYILGINWTSKFTENYKLHFIIIYLIFYHQKKKYALLTIVVWWHIFIVILLKQLDKEYLSDKIKKKQHKNRLISGTLWQQITWSTFTVENSFCQCKDYDILYLLCEVIFGQRLYRTFYGPGNWSIFCAIFLWNVLSVGHLTVAKPSHFFLNKSFIKLHRFTV